MSRRRFSAAMFAAPVFASGVFRSASARAEIQTTPPFLAVPVVVASALQSQGLIGDPWACSVSEAIADQLGVGGQIRVCRGSDHCAVYTIAEVRLDDPDDTIRISKAGRARLGTSQSGFSASLRQALATKKMTENQAKSAGEFIESIHDSGNHQGLLVMAPHGGAIEVNTDRQARRVTDQLAGAEVSSWSCRGYKPGGGAWDRWHVTSTAIHPASFPGLALVSQREYAYALSFHGMSAAGVLIGGAGPKSVKNQLRQAIAAALPGSAGPVVLAEPGDDLGGTSADNVTNWVTANGAGGVQIEQSYAVRTNYWRELADAVASVYAGLL